MAITKITPISGEQIETDKNEYPTFLRWASDNWERIMGESTEPVYDCEGLEHEYQAYKSSHS